MMAQGVPPSGIVAVVRTPGKAASLAGHGVQVREGDYSRPDTLIKALTGVDRMLLISGSELGHLVPQHASVIEAAKNAGVSRIVYTGMLKADESASPLAGEHLDTERLLREAGMPFTVLRNSYYTEIYTDRVSEYIGAGEITGAAGRGKISAATRQDYAAAAAAALRQDQAGNRIYELGGPAFDLTELARVITTVTGTTVRYRDLPPGEYADALRRSGLDEASARFMAELDISVARGDLETGSQDLVYLLGHPVTTPAEVVRALGTHLR
jgi:NAD(P)H dehydrogenase (quinone)